MNVCTLTHTYPRFPGDINAPFVEQLMERIAGCGIDVSVLTAYDPAWNRTPDDHTLDLHTYRYVWPESLHVLGYSRTIEGNVRFRPHVYALSPLLFAGAYRAYWRLVRSRRPDVLHAHWILPNGWIASRVSRHEKVPLIIQLHGSDIFTAEKKPLFRRMAVSAAEHAACIVSPSPNLKDRLVALGADPAKFRIVPNTVDVSFLDGVDDESVRSLRKELAIPESAQVVLTMGRMVYVKGFDYLLKAFKAFRFGVRFFNPDEVVIVLAGGGVLLDEMKQLAQSLGIADYVRFPGPVMREDVPRYFAMADIFVVPSIRHESGAVDGLPVVVPEAMAAGLPVIASNVGGIPVLVHDNKTGMLVPERDVEALGNAIENLLWDKKTRQELGCNAQRLIREQVNYDTVAAYFTTLYDAVAQGTAAADLPVFPMDMD